MQEPDAEALFQLLQAMAQRRLGDAQLTPGGGKATSIDHLHEIEEVIQIEHASLRRPIRETLGSILGDFSSRVHFHRVMAAIAHERRRSCSIGIAPMSL